MFESSFVAMMKAFENVKGISSFFLFRFIPNWERDLRGKIARQGWTRWLRRAPDMAWFLANETEPLVDGNYVLNVLNYINELNESLSSEQFKCLEREHQDQNRKQDRLECEVNWDTILCWPRTPPGTLATIPCFDELNGILYDNTREYMCHFHV